MNNNFTFMIKRITALLAIVLCSLSLLGQENDLDLYLLIGQSNMAGRGIVDGKSETKTKILALDAENEWVVANDPMHFDKPEAGVGPGLSFATEMLKLNPEQAIGLIPCAVGGTSISKWSPNVFDSGTGFYPYDNAIERAKIALKSGTLKGILWHQGEGDSNDKAYPHYKERFETLLRNLATELEFDLDSMPIVIGELGIFFTERIPANKGVEMNKILNEIAQEHSTIECVSSKELIHKGDNIHFDAQSARELGKRYAQAMKKLQEK